MTRSHAFALLFLRPTQASLRLPPRWLAILLSLWPGLLLAQHPARPARPESGSVEELQLTEAQWKFTPDPKLPNVLLIGDSISMGYTLLVRDQLRGVANVYRPMLVKAGHTVPANCSDSASGLKKLDGWLGTNCWQVIHFNFGLHDLKYLDATGKYVSPDAGKQVAPPGVYEKNLRALVARLKVTGAVLIWASTTPVPENSLGRQAGDEQIYNRVAAQVMRENHIPIDDLCAAVTPRYHTLAIKTGNVHYKSAGYQVLASAVTQSVKAVLPSAR